MARTHDANTHLSAPPGAPPHDFTDRILAATAGPTMLAPLAAAPASTGPDRPMLIPPGPRPPGAPFGRPGDPPPPTPSAATRPAPPTPAPDRRGADPLLRWVARPRPQRRARRAA